MINEREVRGAAGLLFAFGFYAFLEAYFTGWGQTLRAFGMFFMIDMFIRIFISAKYSPTIALAGLFVFRMKPEMVGLAQKKYAWSLGFAMAFVSCFGMGWLALPFSIVGWFCLLCLVLLFLEAAFGICVGCWLYLLVRREAPENCPGGVCPTPK